MITSRAFLVPHLPTLLVDEHRRHRTDMLVALEQAAARFAAEEPEAVVVLSARWTAAPPFRVDGGRRHRTIMCPNSSSPCVGYAAMSRKKDTPANQGRRFVPFAVCTEARSSAAARHSPAVLET